MTGFLKWGHLFTFTQLNPVEDLWDEIREKWYPNRVFQSLQAVEDTLVEALVALENDNEGFKA